MNKINPEINTKTADYECIFAPNTSQFQKQFNTYIEVLPRCLQPWIKWETNHLIEVLGEIDPWNMLG